MWCEKQMSGSDRQEYLLGTDEEELSRLARQHRVWAESAFALWERAGFGPGQTILDVGCGPGFATFDLANIVEPGGRVIGIDESERFLSHLTAQQQERRITNIEVLRGDVQRLNLPEGSIDGAYVRWLLCLVREPEAVVEGVARALRPGGSFAVMDYFNYLAFTMSPRSAALDRVVRAVFDSWRSHGGDLDIMLDVPSMMARCGLAVTDVKPVVCFAKPGSALWNWPGAFFRNYLPSLVEGGFLTPEEKNAFEVDWEERSRDPTTFLCTPPMLEVIGVKGGPAGR